MANQLLCNVQVDYSQEPGSVLPFTVALDTATSILNPGPGERQRFCYVVTGVGTDTPTLIDLSHWVLGICRDITEEDIVVESITVFIDDVEQTVTFGENVELVSPDPTTGCSGLKFEFEVNKVGGEMRVCFELYTTYPVGPNPVCLKGGQASACGLSICGPACEGEGACETSTYQTATVCAPVTVTPVATPGRTRTTCCGGPIVNPGLTCPTTNRQCYFTVSQRVCIEVPISFGATASVGDATISCEDISSEGCTECNGID